MRRALGKLPRAPAGSACKPSSLGRVAAGQEWASQSSSCQRGGWSSWRLQQQVKCSAVAAATARTSASQPAAWRPAVAVRQHHAWADFKARLPEGVPPACGSAALCIPLCALPAPAPLCRRLVGAVVRAPCARLGTWHRLRGARGGDQRSICDAPPLGPRAQPAAGGACHSRRPAPGLVLLPADHAGAPSEAPPLGSWARGSGGVQIPAASLIAPTLHHSGLLAKLPPPRHHRAG